MSSALLALALVTMPLPPKVVVSSDAAGPVNVKVRRIGQLQIDSVPAPPPAVGLSGTHRLLVVLVDTADTPWPKGYEPSRFKELLFARSAASLREYYRENSYGAFDLTGEVVGPVRAPGRMADYTFQMGDKNDRVRALVAFAARAAADKVKLSSFDVFDTRGRKGADGVLDHLLIVYAEKTGDPQGFSPIWPHRATTELSAGGLAIQSYLVLNHGAPLGVYAHEFGHDLGLPDLYDRDYSSHGAGSWCTMAAGAWPGGGTKPLHLSAWAKARLGWLTPTVVSEAKPNVRIPSSSEKPFALKLPIGAIDAREYFLLENRRRVGFDAELPAEGLIIWHIDESQGDNDDEKRKLTDVAEADGVQDLDFIEQGRMPDDPADVFLAGKRDLFDDDSNPSARAYGGAKTGIRVKVLSGAERVMTVDIARPTIWNPGGTPFVLDRDGYRYGRFAQVPTGKGSEALMRHEATPGGYLAFGVDGFFVGPPGTRSKVTARLYEDTKGQPGKVLATSTLDVDLGADGYTWVSKRLVEGDRGLRLDAGRALWLGVTADDGTVYPAINPSSTSRQARFRRKGGKLEAEFNFAEGKKPVDDFVLRVTGFGYLDGGGRPEPLAGPEDPLVARLTAADALLDAGKHAEAEVAYAAVLAAMEAEPRRFEAWIPVAVNGAGVAAYELKKYDVARERFLASLRRAQAVGDAPAEADVQQNLCETSFHAGDPKTARAHCERSRALNGPLGRDDRRVENLYWAARAASELGDTTASAEGLAAAEKLAEKAFARDAKALAEWRGRFAAARAGRPDDPDRLAERTEDTAPDDTKPKVEARYQDLLQFLDEDTQKTEE